jgi:predicted nucleic acid-binding protein
MLEWLTRKPIVFHDIHVADLPAIRVVIEKYHNLAPDFTDAALVALADQYDIDAIVTVDVRDFSVYRLADGRSFTRLWR